jgi:uncharacterized protein
VLSIDAAHEATDVEFDAEGATLRGWLYRPRGRAEGAPAVVMAHGYNCIKELYLDRYAAAVADAGHVVLAYDHRNFGDSDGEPRQELDPWMQYFPSMSLLARWLQPLRQRNRFGDD